MVPEERQWGQVFESLENSVDRPLSEERYTVLREVGRGGAKIVYMAVDNNSGREVAFVKPLNSSETRKELFMREARITAYLQHPNVLPVYDVSGEDEVYFVCKLLRGKTLADIRPKQLSRNEKLSLFRKVCEALEYAHSRGVLHLDIKPDNIRLDKYGEVLLIDWGLAEIFCTEGVESPLDNPLISDHESAAKDYTSLGTPGYMSPEQIQGGKVDVRTDIFSLGALFYFMFHMKAPFRGSEVDDVFDKTVSGKFTFNSDELSIGLKSIISKCLEIQPEKRYQRVSELIADLNAFEKDYVPEAENAGFLRHIQLLYKRNRLISNLLIVFLVVLFVLNSRYIKELNSSKTEAVKAKNKAESLLLEVLESQKKNEELTVELSPRYLIEAKRHWEFYRIPQAVKSCDIALKLNPKNSEARLLKGHLLYVNGRYEEADKYFKDAPGSSNMRKMIQRLLESNDPIKIILDKNNSSLKLRDSQLRVLLDQFRQTGNMEYLSRVILMENNMLQNVKLSFKNGELNLSGNPGLDNIKFLGGITFDSLNLSNTSIESLKALSDKKIHRLNLADTPVWDLFSLEGASIQELNLGETKVPSLWALMNIDVKELEVYKHKGGKFPITLLYKLKKLKLVKSRPFFFPPVKQPSIVELELPGSRLQNPEILMSFTKLKKLDIEEGAFPESLLEKLKGKGVEIIQSSSSLKR